MKRRGFTMWEALIILASIAIIAAIVFPVFVRANYNYKSGHCQPNLKQIGLAMQQYTSDFGDKYPPAIIAETKGGVFSEDDSPYSPYSLHWRTPPYGWADALQPYIKSNPVFQCPIESDEPQTFVANQRGYTDYWYNRNLAGKNATKLKNNAIVILLGEGNDGDDTTDARYSLAQLPDWWRTDQSSPAYRHLDGANYTFADGHVKWYKPAQVSDTSKSGQPTLRVF